MVKKILVVLMASLLFAVPAFANDAAKTVVQVSGNSQQEVMPDVAKMNVAVHSAQSDINRAKDENSQTVKRVFAALQEQGIANDQIKTDTYQITPLYSSEKDKLPVLKGYRVTESLEITCPIDQVGNLVNALTNAGANEISSIRFETTNETDSKNEALKAAVQDALKKAEVIAATVNKKVARVTLVNEAGVFYHPVALESRMLKVAADGGVPSIQPGKVTVGANVQVSVELE